MCRRVWLEVAMPDKIRASTGKEDEENRDPMMITELINEIKGIDTSPKKIRDFGITFFVIFGIIGGVLIYKERPFGFGFIGLGLLFLLAGIWAKSSLRGPFKVWMGFAAVLGFFMSRILLSILFYLVITPIGLLVRLLGKDLLNERWNRDAGSYWIQKEKKPFDRKQYEKLF
jgi:hypothetical protein